MVRTLARAALGVAIAAVPGTAAAHNAHALYQDCMGSHSSSARISCLAYLHGLTDGLAATTVLAADGAVFRYCPPRGEISVDELRLIFLKRVESRPDTLQLDAGAFLAEAIRESFACPAVQ